jgi:hypothetical protein
MVELAMVMPVLLTVVLGIFYFGTFLSYSNNQTNMASEAARAAAVNFIPSGGVSIQQYVRAQASPGLLTTSTDVATPVQVYLYFPLGSTQVVGGSVRACVVSVVHYIPILGLGNSTIAQAATMRLEQTPTWTPDLSPPAACTQ